jgi:hypothetical protein
VASAALAIVAICGADHADVEGYQSSFRAPEVYHPPAENLAERDRTITGRGGTSSQTFLVIPVAPPISGEDLDRWTWMLSLSEAQRVHLDRLYEQYGSNGKRQYDNEVRRLWEHSRDVADWRTFGFDIGWAEEVARFIRDDCARVRTQLEGVDRDFFDRLAPVLTDDQLGRLVWVRHQRQRARDNSNSRYLAADVDLIALLFALHSDGFDVTPVDPVAFEDILAEYDSTATALFRSRRDIKERTQRKHSIIVHTEMAIVEAAGGMNNMSAADWDQYRALRERERRLRRQSFNAARRVHELNEEWTEAIAALLPESRAAEFERRFRAAAFVSLYPDPSDPAALLNAAVAIETLSIEERRELEQITRLCGELHRQIADELEGRYASWARREAETRGYTADELRDYVKEMDELHARRIANAQMTVDLLRELLTDEQFAEIEDAAAELRQRIESTPFLPAGWDTHAARAHVE